MKERWSLTRGQTNWGSSIHIQCTTSPAVFSKKTEINNTHAQTTLASSRGREVLHLWHGALHQTRSSITIHSNPLHVSVTFGKNSIQPYH